MTLAILEALHAIAAKHDASYFIRGATARAILMNHVFGIKPGRATRDVDFAIALANWNEFEVIKKEFVERGHCQTAEGETHRLYYQQDKVGVAYPLGLIPFGAIESKGTTIAWPPDRAVVMNVIGYPEALKSAVQVDVGNGLVVDVISIPALAALKLLAWNDRGGATTRTRRISSFCSGKITKRAISIGGTTKDSHHWKPSASMSPWRALLCSAST